MKYRKVKMITNRCGFSVVFKIGNFLKRKVYERRVNNSKNLFLTPFSPSFFHKLPYFCFKTKIFIALGVHLIKIVFFKLSLKLYCANQSYVLY